MQRTVRRRWVPPILPAEPRMFLRARLYGRSGAGKLRNSEMCTKRVFYSKLETRILITHKEVELQQHPKQQQQHQQQQQ